MNRQGGWGWADGRTALLGSVLWGGFGGRLLVESREQDLHISRSVFSADYLIKTVAFLRNRGRRHHSDFTRHDTGCTRGTIYKGKEHIAVADPCTLGLLV